MDRLDTLGTKGTALKAMKCLSNHSPFPFPFLFFFPFFFPFPFPIMFILKIVSKPKSQAWFKVFHYSLLLHSVQEIQGGTTQEFSLQFYYVTFFFSFSWELDLCGHSDCHLSVPHGLLHLLTFQPSLTESQSL